MTQSTQRRYRRNRRNSAQLIRNVITEVNLFTGNGIQSGSALIAESLVVLGLCSLLLLVEPLGALTVVSVVGTAAWGFHRLTRGHIARWGTARQHHDGVRLQHLQQGLGGAKDVTLLGRETDCLDQTARTMPSVPASRSCTPPCNNSRACGWNCVRSVASPYW